MSEKKNIGYIYRSTRTVLPGSSHSYVFNDIVIKFTVAITYYEVMEVHRRVLSGRPTEDVWWDEFHQLLDSITQENRMLSEYKSILTDIKTCFEMIVRNFGRKMNDKPSTTEEVETLIQRIVDRFTRIGVSFAPPNNEIKTDDINDDFCFDNILFRIYHMHKIVVKILDYIVDVNI